MDARTSGLLVVSLIACRSPVDESQTAARSSGDPRQPAMEEHRTLPPADYRRDIGTPHPITLNRVAVTGRWVVACQARADTDGKDGIKVTIGTDALEGDAMVPYLFRGGGAGQAIDAPLAWSVDGRWLAILRDGELVLIDDAEGTETSLRDADVRPGDRGVRDVVRFSADDRRLIYFRVSSGGRRVVVRDLAE